VSEVFDDAFGELLIDARARARFLDDPEVYAEAFDEETASLLVALDGARLTVAAEGLLYKRARHVGELCPALVDALGEGWARTFVGAAQGWLIEGYAKHRADALAFAGWLETDDVHGDHAELAARERRRLGRGVRLRERRVDGRLPSYRAEPTLRARLSPRSR
jgi:hypothetical protein